jgi:hypothetical protein
VDPVHRCARRVTRAARHDAVTAVGRHGTDPWTGLHPSLMKRDPVTTDEMACRELVEVITDYLEGKLPLEDRRRFEAHLDECPYCVIYLEQMRATIVAVGGLAPESITPATRERVLEAFRGWRER